MEALANLARSPLAAEAVAALVLRPAADLAAMRADARVQIAAQGVEVPASRALLAAASPYYEALFRSPMQWREEAAAAGAGAPPQATTLVLRDARAADVRAAHAYAATGGFAFASLPDALAAAEAFDRALMGEAAAAAAEAAKAFCADGRGAVELVAFAHGKAGREALLEWAVDRLLGGGCLVRAERARAISVNV